MASALNSENLTLDKESENKSKNMNTTCPNVPILTTNTRHPLSLEEIQLNQFVENTEDSSKNDGTPKEAGQQTSSPVDNGVEKMQEERDVPRRRYGVVEANDMVTSKRMNARVIRKKFGEGLVSEMPGIFNKKLKLAGKTIFITGASRGIGKAIALKAAKDGANIVIAAKTTEPHPKLPGTIYTAAKEVEEAGGKCLPCAVDIRDEGAVTKAVQEAVKTFGGIDILINNASAISLTGTLETPMKSSQACLPYLKTGKNSHILNISPPLNMNPHWFKGHVAYTMAKYGMSMCVLGMAQEFKDDGIAVNALWPKTAIATAAMEMLGGGKGVLTSCRTDQIMADAAYVVLTRDSRARTGEFSH
ncbi:Hydroxysteroid dehydrogenase-like protein 2 [Desmophyllum pertusum]|uniref:Hydroxysteroid dehydrogenase-like protein 2 n=1 Tax=Desmophyllum pertusum TaxID=174260 RepID=A0A9W9YIR1_9CNID|nr:Hydroxysteroid dehydrogenase-like protein 2 [Desmophyllum pertusum]